MASRPLSFRAYHAALLDYVLGSGESGLASAYELGRMGLDQGSGFLHILHVHEKAVNTILDEAKDPDEAMRRLNASSEFLVEALSSFEMAFRGYRALVKKPADKRHRLSPRGDSPNHH